MRRRLCDASPIQRARKPASPCSSAALDLLDPPPVLLERRADRVGVVEVDVDPDARVRAGDARHVAQRAAGVRERLVALDPRGAGLVRDDVREHVRHVARHRDEAVVRVGVDRDGRGADRGREGVHGAVSVRIRVRDRREEPGGALEERCAGVIGAARFGAADRVAADEARRAVGGLDDGCLRGADVGHGRVGGRGEHGGDGLRQLPDRRGDDDELGSPDRALQAVGRFERVAGRGAREHVGVGIPAGDVVAAPPRSERDGGSHQPGSDDGDPHDRPLNLSRVVNPVARVTRAA